MPASDLVFFIASAAALFGLIVGSFANVVVYRLPLELSIVFPSSRCPHCQAWIKPWQNVPIVSWLFLRGRCAFCRAPISFRYPMVEAIHGLGFAAVILTFGLTPFTPFVLLFFSALVVLAFIDWDHQILPDVITLPGIVLGVASTFLRGAFVSWQESILSAAFGFFAFFLVARGYSRLRGIEGLGMGDWKLAAMLGAFMGGRPLLLTVFLGSLSGMTYGLVQAFRRRDDPSPQPTRPPSGDSAEMAASAVEVETPAHNGAVDEGSTEPDEPVSFGKYRLPFGTFLAASAIFVLFCGDALLSWYSSFFPY